MGTHPIFESDFDCLTECIELRDYLRQSERNQHIQHITGIKLFLALKIHMIVIQDAPYVVQIWTIKISSLFPNLFLHLVEN